MSSQLELFDCGGCNVAFTFQDLSFHIATCEQYPIHCSSCRKGMKRKQLYEHNNVCEKRLLECTVCHTSLFANATADHDNKCLEWVNKRKFEEEIKVYMKKMFTEAMTEANTVNHKRLKEMLGEAISEINNTTNKRQKVGVAAKPVVQIDSEDEKSSAVFEVDAILGTIMIKGVKHYQIRWKPIDGVRWGDSWEPRSNLRHCRSLLDAFENKEEEELADEGTLKAVEIRDGTGHKSDVSRLFNKWILNQPVQSIKDKLTEDVWNRFVQEMGKGKVQLKFDTDFIRRSLRAKPAKDPLFAFRDTPYKVKDGLLMQIKPDNNSNVQMGVGILSLLEEQELEQELEQEQEQEVQEQESVTQLSEEEKDWASVLGTIPKIHINRSLKPYSSLDSLF